MDNIDNVELLTAKNIEGRLADTQVAIEDIELRVGILRRSPGISDKDCNAQIKEVSKDLEKLRTDVKAYQTALDAVPEDYE